MSRLDWCLQGTRYGVRELRTARAVIASYSEIEPNSKGIQTFVNKCSDWERRSRQEYFNSAIMFMPRVEAANYDLEERTSSYPKPCIPRSNLSKLGA